MLNSVSRSWSEVGRSPVPVGRLEPPSLQCSGDDPQRWIRAIGDPVTGLRESPHQPDLYQAEALSPQVAAQSSQPRRRSAGAGVEPCRRPRRAPAPSARGRARRSPTRSVGSAGLPRAEEIARPAQLEVLLRDHESVGRLRHHLQPLARLVGRAGTGTAGRMTTAARRDRRGPAAGAAARGRSARRARSPSRVAFGTSTPTSITVVETSIWISPAANARITRSLTSCFIRPCSSATRYAGNMSVRQVVGHLGGRAQVGLLRLLDERVHDVRLASGVELARARTRRSRRAASRASRRSAPASGQAADRGSTTRRGRRTSSARASAGSAWPS